MAWWNRKKETREPGEALAEKRSVPSGLWQKCDECGAILETAKVLEAHSLCPACGFHFVMPTEARIRLVCDEDSFEERDPGMTARDALGFRDSKRYADRLKSAARGGARDAFRYGTARIEGERVAVGFFVFEFMGGSMGSVVGEKIARLFEVALAERIPAIVHNASGGARMQEGILSLMQMAKTTAALARLREAGIPYLSVLLHPTTGGVAASFAMLGDIILAEPKALIGFAGPRVIEQTIRQKLPPGFQRSEFLLAHGMIDRIVDRRQLKPELAMLVRLLRPAAAQATSPSRPVAASIPIELAARERDNGAEPTVTAAPAAAPSPPTPMPPINGRHGDKPTPST
jgi:acetyl-CoA carboxylase carboxyl transferase subunit beta